MAFSASTSADGIPEPPRADPPPAGPDLLTEPAIATRGLTRRFGEVLAVDAVALTVASGAVRSSMAWSRCAFVKISDTSTSEMTS